MCSVSSGEVLGQPSVRVLNLKPKQRKETSLWSLTSLISMQVSWSVVLLHAGKLSSSCDHWAVRAALLCASSRLWSLPFQTKKKSCFLKVLRTSEGTQHDANMTIYMYLFIRDACIVKPVICTPHLRGGGLSLKSCCSGLYELYKASV